MTTPNTVSRPASIPVRPAVSLTTIAQATGILPKKEEGTYSPEGFYIPSSIKKSTRPSERIALVGEPGTGKSSSCKTFPNRIWLDIDNKCPTGEDTLPFWDPVFCDTLAKRTVANVVNRRDAIKIWLRDNHSKLHPEQTVIVDSWSTLQNAFDSQAKAEEPSLAKTKSGDINDFWLWGEKIFYSREIMEYLTGCKCRVIVTMHETVERNQKGQLTGRMKPLQQGRFADQLLGHFTDTWRQIKDPFVYSATSGLPVIEGGKKKFEPGWFWQLLGDDEANCFCNPDLGKRVVKHNKFKVGGLNGPSYEMIKEIYNLPE